MSSGSIRFVPQRQSTTNLATNATRGVKRVMLGSLTYTRESNYEQRLDKIRSTEAIDNKFGYQRYTGCETRDAWLINVHPSEMVDEQSKVIIAVCDFYFVEQDGQRFKISYPFRPYLYLATLPTFEHQVSSHLSKKYAGIITVEIVTKEDLDLKNHLAGLKRTFLKITFPSMNELQKFKRDLSSTIRKNQEREKNKTSYTALLSKHLGTDETSTDDGEVLEKIIDIREHDVPYEMRVCIDAKIFVGSWYKVVGRDVDRLPSMRPHPTLIDQPDPVILAYDIEVTKLPLKFPDSTIDEIMMISYMIDAHGYLIVNRQIVSDDVEDFEYTPREHDVPYEMRVCIDAKIFVGSWYKVVGRDVDRLPSMRPHPTLIDQPDPVILAYDIEVTKLPLKFPDSTIDEIMMISYMIDAHGYLIVNRQIVSDDVEDFEYTPRPELKGNFHVFNVEDEAAVIKCFFDHILRVRPSIFVTYNGDSFDWPFVEARAAVHGFDMRIEIGFSKDSAGEYKSTNSIHMDAFRWVKRDSYLPVGSQNLKACTKAKLRYNPLELDPEQMCAMAREQPQTLANYSVSDAVAAYYLYMKYVHPFIFALRTIIPLAPDDVLRKGSGTLCEALLMVEAFHNNIIFPNKQVQSGNKHTADGHIIESETYVGGHVEALESGVFRADLPERFRIVPSTVLALQENVRKTLSDALTLELGVKMDEVTDFDTVSDEVIKQMDDLIRRPMRIEKPKIYHLDVGAMYPNIILTNRLQPPAVVTEEDCIACVYNMADAKCKRVMQWEWRGEIMPASKGEYERILQQLENEKFGKPPKPFHALDREQRALIEKKRVQDFCKRAYGRTHVTRNEYRYTTICQRENGFYINTVRAFRDRRYQYKNLLKKAKAALSEVPEDDMNALKSAQGRVVLYESLQLAHKCILNSFYGYKAKAALSEVPEDDMNALKSAQGRVVLYESLQLAHKCILNSFYGYVMRKGSRWFSMEMAGIVCHTGANIITEARKLVEQIGRPLELDTDGIWCLIPASFPENVSFSLNNPKRKSVTVSYPGAMLNALVRDNFTNDQYHHLESDGSYTVTSENSIFFEVDGPYLAMILPASKEEGKKLKKRYAVFNFDGSLAELKGFEVKRRGELAMIKYFQTCVFKEFLKGSTLQEAYENVAKEADYWLDVLFSKGADLPDSELFDLISENRSMSKKLDDYGAQKSTSISTAKRLAEFLGDDMVKDAGLACRFIISKKPIGAPVTERAIPLAIFQAAPAIAAHFLRKWTHDSEITKDNIDIRKIIDWDYYIERVGGTIQKIVTIPAALQNVPNPVPRIPFPDWLENKRRQRVNDHKQPKITELFKPISDNVTSSQTNMEDICDVGIKRNRLVGGDSPNNDGVVPRKRARDEEKEELFEAGKEQKQLERSSVNEQLPFKKKTIVADGVVAWIRYLKAKWKWQKEKRKRELRTTLSRGLNSLQTMVESSRRIMREAHWQLLQLSESATKGVLAMWVIVNGRMLRMNLRVPRIFYVNDRELNEARGTLVKKTLPRMKPIINLYRYSVDESRFQSSLNALNRELCAMRVEGIYESQVPIEFRALLELGCCCKLKSDKLSTFTVTAVELDQLEMVDDAEYLPDNSIRSAFYYEHRQDKRCVIAVINSSANDAIIVSVNAEFPNVNNIYNNEKTRLEGTAAAPLLERKPTINFATMQCSTNKEAERVVHRYLHGIRELDTQPMFITIHSNETSSALARRVPALADFPLVRIHSAEPTNLFSVLDWQRVVARRIIKHYFNSFIYLHDYVEISRYLRIPIGNVPADLSLFAADLFYARNLCRYGYVLWASPTSRPDLGGKELDDCRIGADWNSLCVTDQPTAIVNHSRFCTEVCVELELGALAVSALVHGARIAEAEGSSDSVGFLSSVSLSADVLLGRVKTIAQYDEAAAVSGALKVLRSMLQDCVKDIHINSNPIADQVVINIYREGTAAAPLLERKPTINFATMQCSTNKEAERVVHRYLHGIRELDTQPMFITIHSNETSSALARRVPALADFPLVRIHSAEPTNLFSVLDWQRVVARRIIKHYFNSFIYLHDYVEISRYLRIPIGNVPADLSLFAADLFYARNLCRYGYVLWASPTSRPDLGGKELDDCRIGADWNSLCVTDQPTAIVNHSRFCTEVCVELELGALAVSALVHGARIAEAEGSSDSVGFLSSVSLSADVLLGRVKTIAQYDEAAAVSGALKVLRSMLQDCVKDIHINSNPIADQVVINIYRWVHSPRALLYEPAIARAADMLVTKLCLLLVAEVSRMGGEVMHASQSRLVICTKRCNMQLAEAFVSSLINTLRHNPLFAAVYIAPLNYWNILLWMDMVSGESLVEYREELLRNELSERLFSIVSKLAAYKEDIMMPERTATREPLRNAPLQLTKCIIHFLSLDTPLTEAVDKLRSQLLRLLGYDDSADEAVWRPMSVCCTLSQMFCEACSQFNDLDVCQEGPWDCASCRKPLPIDSIEHVLVERVNQLLIAYTLQDFKCVKCGSQNYVAIKFGKNDEEDNITSKLAIADLLPDEATCKETFVQIILGYIAMISTKMKSEVSGESLVEYREELLRNELSERLFSIVSKLAAYKEDIMMPERTATREPLRNAPLQLTKCIIHFLSLDTPLTEAVDKLRSQLLRLLGYDDSADEAVWRPMSVCCTLSQMFCEACSQFNDLDVCQEGPWDCASCRKPLPIDSIEHVLVERVNQLLIAYTLQDFKCVKCGSIRKDSLVRFCECSGEFEGLVSESDFRFNIQVFKRVSIRRGLIRLIEACEWIQP
ncbi:DNA polymerase epsilon catalytic subunit A [Toxocara canis]|uniref:DNA-directed DNA polymerase n=1 Tax=Toxocara canis TaxID=6265 RepID=A0A0B2UPC6_TOXCA|nr:DNA polymerase epsilon catalytic subunit A [Toxocara canis]